MLNLKETDIQKILVVRLDEIGDFVMTTGFLRELRSLFPQAALTLIVKPQVKSLAETCPYINALFTFNPRAGGMFAKIKKRWRLWWFASRHLKKKYDLAILPRWDADDANATSLIRACRARWKVGYSESVSERKKQLNAGYDSSFTHLIHDTSLSHEVEKNLNVVRFLGGAVKRDSLELWLTSHDQEVARDCLKGMRKEGSQLIALGIGASRPRKTWPLASFLAVCQELKKKACFVVIGGKEDHEGGERLKEAMGEDLLNLAGKLSLRESAAVIQECALFIGNDSGPKHIAAAVHTPTIEISCHPLDGDPQFVYSPKRFRPWGAPHRVLRPEKGCAPCSQGCTSGKAHCILAVEPRHVITQVDSVV